MIKLKMMAVSCAVLSFIFCTAVTVRAWGQASGDSPVNIGGGSIFGKLRDPKAGWTIISPKEVHAQSNNIGAIFTSGIETVKEKVEVPKGWVIILSNKKKQDGSENQNAVLICSDAKCKGNALDPNQTIYLRTRSGSRWTVLGDGSLHFHDNNCDGPTGDNEDKACDSLVKVRIQSPRGNDVANGTCINGTCQIGIGGTTVMTKTPGISEEKKTVSRESGSRAASREPRMPQRLPFREQLLSRLSNLQSE